MERDEIPREELLDGAGLAWMRDWKPPKRPLLQRVGIVLGKVFVAVWGLAWVAVQLGILALLAFGVYYAIKWVFEMM